jgi:hypothetical protein
MYEWYRDHTKQLVDAANYMLTHPSNNEFTNRKAKEYLKKAVKMAGEMVYYKQLEGK